MFNKILVAYDESPESRTLLTGIHLAKSLNAELRAVWVQENLPPYAGLSDWHIFDDNRLLGHGQAWLPCLILGDRRSTKVIPLDRRNPCVRCQSGSNGSLSFRFPWNCFPICAHVCAALRPGLKRFFMAVLTQSWSPTLQFTSQLPRLGFQQRS